MAFLKSFVGGFYTARSTTVAVDQAINVYSETREVEGSPKQVTLYGTPGLKLFATVSQHGNRGWFTQDDRTWTVVGDQLYEVNIAVQVATAITTIPDDGLPVSFASNGKAGDQLGVVGGGRITVVDLVTNIATVPVLPFSGPVMLAFLDGYGLINQAESPVVWFSALEDFETWDGLDFFTRSGTSDNLVGIGVSRDRVWAFGSKTTTLFYDSGDTDTPFLPYPGTAMQVGLVSPWLLGLYNDTWFWVAQIAKGQRSVVMATDPQAQPISTPPIATQLSACATLDDAYLLVYEQNEHPFITVVMPSSAEDVQAYSYDVREKVWHARAGWDSTTGRYTRWRARGTTSTQGLVCVGDYASGDLYTLDLETYDDNGAVLVRERTAPYLSTENQWLFLDQFELGMQPGVGLSSGQGSDPVATLEISRDGAHTWVSAGSAALGAIGQYLDRAIWRRLGRARADRLVIRVRQTDPVPCVWTGAWLRTSPGNGQL